MAQTVASSTQGSEVQSLEQAVQELLSALQQQGGGSAAGAGDAAGGTGTAGAGAAGAGDAAGAGGGAAGAGSAAGAGDAAGATGAAGASGAAGAGDAAGATGAAQTAAGGTATPGNSDTLNSDYNNVLSAVAAVGNSPQNVQAAVSQFQQDAKAAGSGVDPTVQQAMSNISNSLGDGTYSQQGSEGGLQGAAAQDGMSGVNTVSIAGAPGGAAQAAGQFNANTNAEGSLGANTAILESELQNGGGQGSQQITNNANALAQEASLAGNSALATAATGVANGSGGSAGVAALQGALPDATQTTSKQQAA